MNQQSDLFEQSAGIGRCPLQQAITAEQFGDPIAVPCGFIDRTNSRCRRLGNRPVMVDGTQMVGRGRPMIHCDPACYSALGLERQTVAEANSA